MEVTVQQAKTQLSRLLRRVEAGEDVLIRRGREPVAVLVKAPRAASGRQIWGGLEGSMSPDFDEPLEEFDAHS